MNDRVVDQEQQVAAAHRFDARWKPGGDGAGPGLLRTLPGQGAQRARFRRRRDVLGAAVAGDGGLSVQFAALRPCGLGWLTPRRFTGSAACSMSIHGPGPAWPRVMSWIMAP